MDNDDIANDLVEAIRAGTAKVIECMTLGRPTDAEQYANVTRDLCSAVRELTEAAVIAQGSED